MLLLDLPKSHLAIHDIVELVHHWTTQEPWVMVVGSAGRHCGIPAKHMSCEEKKFQKHREPLRVWKECSGVVLSSKVQFFLHHRSKCLLWRSCGRGLLLGLWSNRVRWYLITSRNKPITVLAKWRTSFTTSFLADRWICLICGKLSLILIAIFQWRCHNASCTSPNRSKLDTQGNWLTGIQLKDTRELFLFESPFFLENRNELTTSEVWTLSNCISPNKTGTDNHDSKSPGWLQLSRIIWRTDVVGDCHINLICWAHGVDDVVNVLSHPFDDPPLERHFVKVSVSYIQHIRVWILKKTSHSVINAT